MSTPNKLLNGIVTNLETIASHPPVRKRMKVEVLPKETLPLIIVAPVLSEVEVEQHVTPDSAWMILPVYVAIVDAKNGDLYTNAEAFIDLWEAVWEKAYKVGLITETARQNFDVNWESVEFKLAESEYRAEGFKFRYKVLEGVSV